MGVGSGVWRWAKRKIIYPALYTVPTRMTPALIKMGNGVSHFNISLIVRDKVTRRCPQATTFEAKGEPKRIRTEVPLLTVPYSRPNRLMHSSAVVLDSHTLS